METTSWFIGLIKIKLSSTERTPIVIQLCLRSLIEAWEKKLFIGLIKIKLSSTERTPIVVQLYLRSLIEALAKKNYCYAWFDITH